MNTHVDVRRDPTAEEPSAEAAGEIAGVEIDIRQIWSVIYRNRLPIVVVVGLALIAGVLITMLTTRIYSASASVQIEQQTEKVLGNDELTPGLSSQESDRFLQTQIDIIKSRALAERVAQSLNLAADNRFYTDMGGKISSADATTVTAEARRERALGLLQSNLSVTLPRNSRIVTIAFNSPSPQLAMRVSNSYAQNFIMANLQRRYDASSYARGFLENQLKLAKQRLEDSERATIAYARSAGLLDTSAGIASTGANGEQPSGGVRSLTTSDLVQFNNALVLAKSARVAAQDRWEEASRTALLNLPEVQTNPAISALLQQRALAQAAYEQERQRHKSDFPTMKQSRAQIDELGSQIDTIASRLRDGIRNQYEVAQRQETSLKGTVDQLRGVTLGEQDRSVQYNILRRETDTNRTMYDGLLQRYKEVSAQSGISSNNISMLDAADLPTFPVSPRPMLNLAIAGLAGLALAAMMIFARERFDDAIRSPDDVSRKLGLPFLSSIPLVPSNITPLEALDNPRSSLAEAYFALRTSLRLMSAGGVPASLLFTSSREAEGKSTTAYAIARGFAQIGMNVLLVDGDLRRPSLHRLMGTLSDVGLANVLARQTSLAVAVKSTNTPNLSFLPAGPTPPSPAELLSGQGLPALLQEAASRFDLVVIDGPPVLGLADSVLLSAAVAGTIFVVEAGRPNHGHAKAALRRIAVSGARVYGGVLTKFDPRHAGYGSDYGYYYSYGMNDAPREASA